MGKDVERKNLNKEQIRVGGAYTYTLFGRVKYLFASTDGRSQAPTSGFAGLTTVFCIRTNTYYRRRSKSKQPL